MLLCVIIFLSSSTDLRAGTSHGYKYNLIWASHLNISPYYSSTRITSLKVLLNILMYMLFLRSASLAIRSLDVCYLLVCVCMCNRWAITVIHYYSWL